MDDISFEPSYYIINKMLLIYETVIKYMNT